MSFSPVACYPRNSPPTTIFFLRHGARLDQFDPEWHLSSPTPYDPPLTTRGVAQARQTGSAIKDSLPRSKHRIILHTSPFLRCIQTALALAAGVEEKVLLRIDAWLGEWLTPDYYTDIDPPPPGRQLCSSALTGLAGRTDGIGVDWMWDSMKLGDGGEYGEEWGSMHERFHAGLKRLLRHYEDEAKNEAKMMNGDAGEGVQTVVILVTHGAGCNALLGALSHKPVLTDIPISSLSMAVLRPSTPSTFPPPVEYDLLLQASTAHLATSPPLASTSFSRASSPHSRDSISSLTPIITDKRILEYHPVRSRSVSSLSPTYSDPPSSTYQPRVPLPGRPIARHPSLTLQTSSGLFGSSNSESARMGLWSPNSSAALSEDEEELELGSGRRKRAIGLWKNWAADQ
jgi:broad specificity phosphatase PhoE